MRRLTTILALLALTATPVLADHGHDQEEVAAMEEAHIEHISPEAVEAPEIMDHATMDDGSMNHDEGHKMDSDTMPAAGAVLPGSPQMIGVKFAHVMKVDAIVLSTLTGEMIELDVSEIDETDHVMVDAPELQPDDYIVDWRARGADGHIMSGSFAFTIE